MAAAEEIRSVWRKADSYLREFLLPFWFDRAPDRLSGGFLTYIDRHGARTDDSDKTFLMQIRVLYAMSRTANAGIDRERCIELARSGADFILEHFWDRQHGGWYWVADREGQTLDPRKIGYGQCFAIYAFAEYFLATGDERGREAMLRSHAAVQQHMRDATHGGYLEIMERDWRPTPGTAGGDRKSFDVHMHMMEALTRMVEVTGEVQHRRELEELIDLILSRMLEPERGVGRMQFSLALEPLEAIRLATEWGSDEEPAESEAFPIDTTSYGHNVEFGWLLMRAVDALDLLDSGRATICRRIYDHCLEFGIDTEYGGVYVDGPVVGPPLNDNKQFWQQAEVMVGMLDGFERFGDERYWRGFRSVFDFVFAKCINWQGGGEWYALLDRRGEPIWDYLGHAWKICYHTVRAMVEIGERLERIAGDENGA